MQEGTPSPLPEPPSLSGTFGAPAAHRSASGVGVSGRDEDQLTCSAEPLRTATSGPRLYQSLLPLSESPESSKSDPSSCWSNPPSSSYCSRASSLSPPNPNPPPPPNRSWARL